MTAEFMGINATTVTIAGAMGPSGSRGTRGPTVCMLPCCLSRVVSLAALRRGAVARDTDY